MLTDDCRNPLLYMEPTKISIKSEGNSTKQERHDEWKPTRTDRETMRHMIRAEQDRGLNRWSAKDSRKAKKVKQETQGQNFKIKQETTKPLLKQWKKIQIKATLCRNWNFVWFSAPNVSVNTVVLPSHCRYTVYMCTSYKSFQIWTTRIFGWKRLKLKDTHWRDNSR